MRRPELVSLIARRPRLTLAVAVFLAMAVGAMIQRLPRPAVPLRLTPVVRAVLTDPGSPSVGPLSADVVIVVFTDYQCAICKTTDPALMRLLARDSKVRVIFKDWPVFGAGSHAAARAVIAAHRQGRYLAFHAALMAARGPLNDDRIRQLATSVGVDGPRLQADLAARSAELDSQIAGHASQAWSLGLQGTPGYVVGPYLIPGGLDDHQLKVAVRRARKAGGLLERAVEDSPQARGGEPMPWSGHAAPPSPVLPQEG